MRRYGYREQAADLTVAMMEAAAFFDHLLPEVFAGYARQQTTTPVEYPTACRPQAWAAGTPMLVLRTLLGLDANDQGLSVQPHLPPHLGPVRLSRIPVRGQYFDAG
jgi:glycogen debranching enzyme